MNNTIQAQYRQNMKVVVNLLKVFGKTDPQAAAQALRYLTMNLLADIRKSQPCGRDAEVIR